MHTFYEKKDHLTPVSQIPKHRTCSTQFNLQTKLFYLQHLNTYLEITFLTAMTIQHQNGRQSSFDYYRKLPT